MVIVRIIVAVTLVAVAVAPGIAQAWQSTAAIALGAGLVTVLIREYQARKTNHGHP